jgi:hypothetical protein
MTLAIEDSNQQYKQYKIYYYKIYYYIFKKLLRFTYIMGYYN